MSKLSINLLPADFQSTTFEHRYKDILQSIEFERFGNNLQMKVERHNVVTKAVTGDLYGFIRIKCLVTGRAFYLDLPEVENYTIHAVNNGQLLKNLADKPDYLTIAITDVRDVLSPKGEVTPFIEDGVFLKFVMMFTQVDLVASCTAECTPLHVFHQGTDKIPESAFEGA